VKGDREEGETKRGDCCGDEGIFAEGELEAVLVRLESAQILEDGSGDVADIAIVIFTAKAGGDLLEGTDILAGLSTVDHRTFGGIADTHDEGSADGGRHFRHAGGGNGVAIADEEEGGGIGRPIAGDLCRFLEPIKEARFANGEDGREGKAIEKVEDDFHIAALLDDRFRSVVNRNHGDVELVIGGAFKQGLHELGGAFGSGEAGVFARVLEFHRGRDIDDEEKVAAFLWLDFLDLGAMGFWFEKEDGGEGPSETAEKKNAQDGGENGKGGEAAGGSESEVADLCNTTDVQGFRAGSKDGGRDGNENGDEHLPGGVAESEESEEVKPGD
jgi:hypothetical protein